MIGKPTPQEPRSHEHAPRPAAKKDAPLNCLPHLCSKAALSPESRTSLLRALKDDLDVVVASSGESPIDGGISSPALLITCGGPARAESIVQAHALISTVRELHGDAKTPVEVWHGGEPGMDSSCRAWATAYRPLQCFHAHGEAHMRIAPKEDTDDGTALARALGLLAKTPSFEYGFNEATDGPALAASRASNLRLAASRVGAPALEWVRGWPIKPLALLLTRHELVVMVDADSIPLASIPELLAGALAAPLAAHGNVFWPDIMPLGEEHAEVRKALGLGLDDSSSLSESAGSSAVDMSTSLEAPRLQAESGQVVVRRSRCLGPLRLAWVLNAHPVAYTLLHGDKDTFRLAFDYWAARAPAHVPRPAYFQVTAPPAALGGAGPQTMADGSAATPTVREVYCGTHKHIHPG